MLTIGEKRKYAKALRRLELEAGYNLSGRVVADRVERETRIELATLCLGSRCSTTELLPPGGINL